MQKQILYLITTSLILLTSCASDDNESYIPNQQQEITSPVVFNPEAALFDKLSDYNFFEGELSNLSPVYGVIPYKPINSLFTDYALKKRFVWMPENTQATYVSDASILNFPVGAVLIKNFYYNTIQPNNTSRIIETRIMYNTSSGWKFAEYVWNDEQTEAFLDLSGSTTNVSFIENGIEKNTSYRIPSEAECFTCHKSAENTIPIAVKPQNINSDYTYTDGPKNQLSKWIEVGYLNNNLPNTINTVKNWENTNESLEDRIRGYLDINCAHCHSDDKHCNYRPIRLAYNDYIDDTSLGICITPEDIVPPPQYTKIIEPGNFQRSVMHYRLSSTNEQFRMPLLGRTLVHEEGIALLEEWINSLTPGCN